MSSFSKGLALVLALALPAVAQSADTETKAAPAAAKVYKVNELYKEKSALDKQKVTVRGKVVKVASGIMKRNWVHIQDATVRPTTPDKDLTVTTNQQPPKVGDIVTISGTVSLNKDFGSGYFYDLIVEQASIE